MRLMLIRHGETHWNTLFKTQGHTDEPLNETGREQSRLLSKRLERTHIDCIYSSPLSRAYETANAVALPRDMKVITEPLMLERDFGDWEGVTFGDLRIEYPELIKLWRENPYECTPPNAETIASVIERAKSFLDGLKERHGDNETVLVAGHSVPLRLMIAMLMGIPYERMHSIWIDNASVTIISLYPAVLRLLNDTAHLEMSL